MKKLEIADIWKEILERFQKNSAANLFLIIALVGGIAMACINPPFQECDGWVHFLRAMDVSHGNLLSPVVNLTHKDGGIVVPENVEQIGYHLIDPGSGEGGEFIQHLKELKFSTKVKNMNYNEQIISAFYYPQALGLFLGQLFGMSVYGCVVFSRLINLLIFLNMTYTAIRITPILKNTLAVLALFPMTIYQASSQSPDAMLNGLCFLFTAMCLWYAYGEKESLGWKDALKLGTVLAGVFLFKYVYVCLGLLVFLIPLKKFGTKKEYWKSFFIALIPVFIVGAVVFTSATSAVAMGQASEGGITQTQYLAEHPLFIVQVLIETFMSQFNDYMMWLNVLGSLNYSLGPLIYIVPMFAIFTACLDSNEICYKIKWKDKVLCFGAFLLVSIGIVMGIYIGDGRINEVGAAVVQGVQGRYFIGVLPVLFVAINQKGVQNKIKNFTLKTVGGMGILLLCSVLILRIYCFYKYNDFLDY